MKQIQVFEKIETNHTYYYAQSKKEINLYHHNHN